MKVALSTHASECTIKAQPCLSSATVEQWWKLEQ